MSIHFANRILCVFILTLCCSSITVAVISGSDTRANPTIPEINPDLLPVMQDGRQGFLLTLEVRHGRTRLTGAAEIDNYGESKHLVSEDDWNVLLLDGADNCLGTLKVGNPGHNSPIVSADQVLPMTVKVPRPAGMAAIAVLNQYREEQLQIPVGNAFMAEAAARRRQFLDHDRENRRLLSQPAMFRESSSVPSFSGRNASSRLEDMPEDVRRTLRGEIALGMERVAEYGPEAVALGEKFGMEPQEVRRQLMMPDLHPASAASGAMDYPAAGTPFTLSGQVTDADTGMPVAGALLYFHQYDSSSRYVGSLGSKTTDAGGNYSIGVDVGNVWVWPVYSAVVGKRYAQTGTMIRIDRDTIGNIKAIPGVLLSGTVTDSNGQGINGANVIFYLSSASSSLGSRTLQDGSYALVVPANLKVRIYLTVPSPYLPPPDETNAIFIVDTVRDYKLETGSVVTGTVKGNGGVAISGASVMLRQLASTTTSAPYSSASTDANGKYALVVSWKKMPNSFIISAYASGYLLQWESLDISGDTTCDFQLEKGFAISGTVRDSTESPVSGARVRAYEGGVFFVSALTKSDGSFAFDLPAGIYDFEALPSAANSRQWAPATTKNIPVSEARAINLVLPAAAGVLTVRLYYPDQATYNRYASPQLTRFEFSQSGRTMLVTNGLQGSGALDQGRQKYYRPVTIYLENGKYALTAFPMGCAPIILPEVEVSGQTSVSIDVPLPFLWTGSLRGADKAWLPGVYVRSYNDLANVPLTTLTDSFGGFSIFLTPNGFAKFYADAGSNNILHTERFGNVTASRNDDVILDQFPAFTDSGSPLTQIYGVTDRRTRWNIVMIGDGYTGVKETYTDLNSNRQWDGVLYYDLNKNGVWDTGEPYQRYGNAPAPTAGADPALNNEPFVDLNGDGVPNLHDQELFDQNTLDTARSLFGQDEWRRHREAFNIFRIRLVSNQAGHKIYDRDGKIIIDRDTVLGSDLNTPDRSFLFNSNCLAA